MLFYVKAYNFNPCYAYSAGYKAHQLNVTRKSRFSRAILNYLNIIL